MEEAVYMKILIELILISLHFKPVEFTCCQICGTKKEVDMKTVKLFSLFVLIILPVIFFTGCNKHDDVTSPNANFDSAEYLMIDYFDASNAIEEATIDTDLSINPTMLSYSFVNAADFTPGKGMLRGMMVNWLTKYDWNKHLGVTFRRLKLDDDQKTKVDVLMKAYHESMKPLVKEFAEANKTTIENANVKRKEIAEKVKAGTITRAEAVEQIKNLNERVRNAIESNEATIAVKRKMCANRKTLLNGIRLILTSDQQEKWDDAVARMKTPC